MDGRVREGGGQRVPYTTCGPARGEISHFFNQAAVVFTQGVSIMSPKRWQHRVRNKLKLLAVQKAHGILPLPRPWSLLGDPYIDEFVQLRANDADSLIALVPSRWPCGRPEPGVRVHALLVQTGIGFGIQYNFVQR